MLKIVQYDTTTTINSNNNNKFVCYLFLTLALVVKFSRQNYDCFDDSIDFTSALSLFNL